MRSLSRSNAHFKKAIGKMPLGVSSNFRYWGDDKTIYIDHGKGARIRDIDDNEYIDYRLGYGDERVDAAAREGMNVGAVFALSTELEEDIMRHFGDGVARTRNYRRARLERTLVSMRISQCGMPG